MEIILFESIDKDKMIKGVRYYIKDYYCKTDCIKIYVELIKYICIHEQIVLLRAHEYYSFYQKMEKTIVYRCVTRKEFYEKVKEKYDRKVLNIILKRLIDESFQFD